MDVNVALNLRPISEVGHRKAVCLIKSLSASSGPIVMVEYADSYTVVLLRYGKIEMESEDSWGISYHKRVTVRRSGSACNIGEDSEK